MEQFVKSMNDDFLQSCFRLLLRGVSEILRWWPKAGDDYQRVLYLLSVSSTTPGRRSISTWQLVWSAGLMFTSSSQTWQKKRKNLKTLENLMSIGFLQSRKRKVKRMRTANLDHRFSLLRGKGERQPEIEVGTPKLATSAWRHRNTSRYLATTLTETDVSDSSQNYSDPQDLLYM